MIETAQSSAVRSGVPHPADSPNLLVLSNRAPVRVIAEDGIQRLEPTVGGVGGTFVKLLEQRGGSWIAWSGSKSAPAPLMLPAGNPRFAMIFAPLAEDNIASYYDGMCNRGLWPLMHLMAQHCRFKATDWSGYRAVNTLFAQMAVDHVKPGEQVWIQDFHLALVAGMVRRQRPATPIGLFWHVPFPPESLFRIFPWRRELLEGMLGADLIGFHIDSYADYFIECCRSICGLEVDRARRLVSFEGRLVKVGAFPLGIATGRFTEIARSLRTQAQARRIRAALGTPLIALGVDRLDYTKGLLERVAGFERLLESRPEYRRRITLVQIAVPSRTKIEEYVSLKRQMDEAVGRVTGRFSAEGWVPIRYLYEQFEVEDLVPYYQAADVALVTPLRDGMNLVAKEYVATRVGDDGALILSEFAGAAEELREALLVNPYDIEAIARRLHQALSMGATERSARMRALRERVRTNDLDLWAQNFLDNLTERRLTQVRYAAGTAY